MRSCLYVRLVIDGIVGGGGDTHSEPHEAWQLRQWQRPACFGKEEASISTVIAPQLQTPRTLSEVEVIVNGIVICSVLCCFRI